MDRHFCDTYANTFADSNSDGYPKPKRHSDGKRIQLCFGDRHRQPDPTGDNYSFAVSNANSYTYIYSDTCIAEPFA